MEYDEWKPAYRAILADFGFDRGADEHARDRLGELLAGSAPLSPDDLSFDGQEVAIAGAGPSLAAEIDVATSADAVVAASSAASTLADAGVELDCVVTDLDGDPDRTRTLNREGTPVAVHAHGDNVPTIEEYVPTLDAGHVLPTTQARPVPPVVNTGGFTDGDRAAFLADHCGADALVFPGWDFEDPSVGGEKARKLRWAERLLYWLERRRGERFGVLDGRRASIETGPLPVD